MTRHSRDHHESVLSSLHVHLDYGNGSATVVLHGGGEPVRPCADAVSSPPGVRHGKLRLLPNRASDEAHSRRDHGTPQRHLNPA